MNTRLFVAGLICGLFVTGCSARSAGSPESSAAGEKITLSVFAAASLTESFAEIARSFEAEHTGIKVAFNFAGSQQLAQQLTHGAPADVFASANQKQMEVVIADGRIAAGSELPFIKNRLVVIIPTDNPANIAALADLAQPGLRLVLAAKEVPAGQYALEFLDKAAQEAAFGQAYQEAVFGNMVSYEDNVKAVLSKVALGEADAGIVYSSDITGANTARVGRIDIPETLNVIATYPIAPLNDSPNSDLARAFIAYVMSEKGQRTLETYGFTPIQ